MYLKYLNFKENILLPFSYKKSQYQAQIQGGRPGRVPPYFGQNFDVFNAKLVPPEGAGKIWTIGRPPFENS